MAGRAASLAPVTWRDGIHVTGTSIWCDALRTRDVCFVSSADAVANARHAQLVATADTLALLGAPASASGTRLPVPYHRPFTLGTVRLELLPSGHGLGGASLLLEVDGARVLYCNDICPQGGGLGGVAESRPCDALVLGAHYGEPGYRFPEVAELLPRVADFVQETTSVGAAAVLLVGSASKCLDVASRLTDALNQRMPDGVGPTFFAHRSLHEPAQRLRADRPGLPRLRRYPGRMPAGHILFWPIARRARLPADDGVRVALVSGSAMDEVARARLQADVAFPWSDRADHPALMGFIDACRPREIFLTGAHAESMGAQLSRAKRPVHALVAPRQIELFRAHT